MTNYYTSEDSHFEFEVACRNKTSSFCNNAKMAEIEALLVGIIQARKRKIYSTVRKIWIFCVEISVFF